MVQKKSALQQSKSLSATAKTASAEIAPKKPLAPTKASASLSPKKSSNAKSTKSR